MKYRVIWNTLTKVVIAVIIDEGGTITNYPDVDHAHAVVDDLSEFKTGLLAAGYDMTILDDFIAEL